MGRKASNPFKLSDQQIAFADAYHRGGCANAEQSAIEAKYSANYARGNAHKLVAIVGEYLKTLQAKTAVKNDGQRDKNLSVLKGMASLDITSMINECGEIVVPDGQSIKALPKEVRLCIASIKQSAYGVEVKFYDKLKAIEMINRMCGYNEPEKHDHTVKGKEDLIKSFFGSGE